MFRESGILGQLWQQWNYKDHFAILDSQNKAIFITFAYSCLFSKKVVFNAFSDNVGERGWGVVHTKQNKCLSSVNYLCLVAAFFWSGYDLSLDVEILRESLAHIHT